MAVILPLLVALLPLAVWCSYEKLRQWRLRYRDVPQPPPSLLWGHLKLMGEWMAKGLPDRHTDYAMRDIGLSLGNPPFFLLDLRPIVPPLCMIMSHEAAEYVSKPQSLFKYSTPKSPTFDEFIDVTGALSILRSEGEDWKKLRKRFNAGFAPQHLMTLLPEIVKNTRRFVARLEGFAESGSEFALGDLCTSFTFDVIAAVTMGLDINAQSPPSEQNPLVQCYKELLRLYTNSVVPVNWIFAPVSTYRRRKLGQIVDAELSKHVRAEWTKQHQEDGGEKQDFGRSVLSLSLKNIKDLTPTAVQETVDQLKTFLFAGHDTTSTLLQWALYELSRSPTILQTLRHELDTVLGPAKTPSETMATLLTHGDEALSKLAYTSAIIKETLRLFPPAGTARMTPHGAGFTLRTSDGTEVCLDGTVLYNCHFAIQRDPKVFGATANDFRPDRWLGDLNTSSDEYARPAKHHNITDGSNHHDVKGDSVPMTAWRPFERGPRNCIGQELANIEARVVLAVVARHFDFQKVGMGALKVDSDEGGYVMGAKGQYEVVEPLLNTRQITSKPLDNCMMRVQLHGMGER